MTAGVNSLTSRATAPTVPAGTIPTGHVRALIDALVRLGLDRAELVSFTGCDGARLGDPDAYVPAASMINLICAVELRRIPNLGLKIASEVPVGAYPLLDYLVLTSDSVAAGMHALQRYLLLTGSPAIITIDESGDPIRIVIEGTKFSVEFSTALIVHHLKRETEGRFMPAFIAFAHEPDDAAEFETRLATRASRNADWSGVAVSRATWQLPLRRRDPILRDLLQRQAEEARITMPQRVNVIDDVRNAVIARLGGDLSVRAIASDLNTTGRTLQRRLGSAATSYEAVRDGVLREVAERCLAAGAMSIGEIAFLLGYSETAAFHRAFKRWTGSTPRAFRSREP